MNRSDRAYGVLSQSGPDTVEFTVAGSVDRVWKLGPPVETMADLLNRCLTILGADGWRPISHDENPAKSMVLARVPYPAGSKLSVYGVLRFLESGTLVLSVSGSVMQRWPSSGAKETELDRAIRELETSGWRLHRRFRHGATVVRG